MRTSTDAATTHCFLSKTWRAEKIIQIIYPVLEISRNLQTPFTVEIFPYCDKPLQLLLKVIHYAHLSPSEMVKIAQPRQHDTIEKFTELSLTSNTNRMNAL
jgi:hypothetical protein